MRAVADIDPRGAGLRAVTVVAWHATVICEAFGRDMDAQAPSANAVLNEARSSRRRVEESPFDRESGAPTHAQRDGVAA